MKGRIEVGNDLSKASAIHIAELKKWVDNKIHFVGGGKK